MHFFRYEKKKFLFSFLFLHSCNRNSLAGLVHFFRLKKNIYIFSFPYCFYIYVIETHQLDLYTFFFKFYFILRFHDFLFFLYLCNRNSLAELVNYFTCDIYFTFLCFAIFPTFMKMVVSNLRICRPPFRSGHRDIKKCNVLKK